LELDDGWALEAEVRVAPAAAAVRDVGVVVGDVDATGEADAAVDDERLAVVAAGPAAEHLAPPGREAERGGSDHADARALEEGDVRRRERGAPGVVEQADLDAGARPLGERRREEPARPVGAQDVRLEADRGARPRDGVEHRGERLRAVLEERE